MASNLKLKTQTCDMDVQTRPFGPAANVQARCVLRLGGEDHSACTQVTAGLSRQARCQSQNP